MIHLNKSYELIAATLLIVCGVAVLLPTVVYAQDTAAIPHLSPVQLQRAIHSDLVRYLHRRGESEHISAVSASVSLHGGMMLICAAAGTMELDGEQPVTLASMFQIGSITKSFTAAILLQLEAEGKLTLDDPIGKWLPQYPSWSKVTIRQLLNMTSGISTYDHVEAFQHAYATAPRTNFTPAQLVDFVKGEPLRLGWYYSNTNYELAQMIISKVSHHSYAFELQKRLFDPVDLQHTFYNGAITPSEIRYKMPAGYFFGTGPENAGYKPLYGKDVRGFSLSWAQAAGGIISTPHDVALWVRALYLSSLLQPKQRKELLSLVSVQNGKPIYITSSKNPTGYGLGVGQSYGGKNAGPTWFYEGETLGYRMLYVWLPKTDVVIVVALNSSPIPTQDNINQLVQSIYDEVKLDLGIH